MMIGRRALSETIDRPETALVIVDEDKSPSTALAIVRQNTSVIVGLDKDDILGSLREKLAALPTDISTKKNREAIASASHSVSTTKTALLKLADQSIESAKKTVKSVTDEKKSLEAMMDALRDKVRAPVTAWEQVEKDRIKGHEDALAAMSALASLLPADASSEQVRESLERLDLHEDGREWQEFAMRASDTHAATGFRLTNMLAAAVAREEAAAEAERLRLEAEEAARVAAEKAQREREQRIATEAAEAARVAAEARAAEAAAMERQRVEQERLDAEDARREAEIAAQAEIEAMEEANRLAQERARQAEERAASIAAMAASAAMKAERDRKESEERAASAAARKAVEDEIIRKAAETKAEQDTAYALAAERRRIADEELRLKREDEKRAADFENRARVHREMLEDLIEHVNLTDGVGRRVVEVIVRKLIRNTRVDY